MTDNDGSARARNGRAAGWGLLSAALLLPAAAGAQVTYHATQNNASSVGIDGSCNVAANNTTTQVDYQWRTLFGSAVGGTSTQMRTQVSATAWFSMGRVYRSANYASATTITSPGATLYLRSTSLSDQFQVLVRDYDPSSTTPQNGVTLFTSNVVNSPNTGGASPVTFTFTGPGGAIPANHRLVLEVLYLPAAANNVGRVYLNATANDSTLTVTETASSPPGTPGTPTYSAITSAGATVAWTAATGATSYSLQRAIDSGFTSGLSTFTAVVSPYVDSSAPTGNTTYWYRAVAVNAGGSTSGAGSSVLVLPVAPAAPSFSNVTSTGVTVSWAAPAGGAASYNVQRATNAGFTTGLTTFTNVGSPYTDAGPLTAGGTYWYRVVAVNASGSSAGTGASVLTAPGAPGTPTYSSITSTGATVAWTAGTGATSYNLQRATDSGFTSGLSTFTAVVSPYADSSAPTGNTTYWYRAVAVNAGGSTSGAGSSVLVLPVAPAAPSFSNVTSTGVTVSWAAPAGGAASYNVQRATNAGFTTGLATFTNVGSPYTDAGPLTAGGTYWYRVVAVNATGSSTGAGASVVTLPGAPGTPTFSAVAATTATVSWTAATGATSYNLQRATDGGFTANLATLTGVTSPYVDGALAGSTTYWYRVVAVNAGGSTSGAAGSVTTPAGPPGAPGPAAFTAVAQTTLTVSWAPASGATSYNLQRALDSGFATGLTTRTGVTSPYPDSGLTANTTYWYRVVAVNAIGSTNGSGSSVTTLPNPPGAPGAPTYSAVSQSAVTVSWTTGAGATSHDLQRATNSAFTTGLGTFAGATSPYLDAGPLSPGTTYWYRAVAVNAGGSTTGASSSVTTLAAATLTVAAGTMPAGTAVAAGTPSTVVGRISLTSSAPITVASLAVANGGTALSGDVVSVQLFDDATGTWLGFAHWTGTQYLFENLSYSVTGTKTVRVVVGLSSGAVAGRTFRLTVPAGAVTVLAPNTVNAYTSFSGNLFTAGAGPTEGDATASSTGPVLRIVNPRDGGTVTLSPASPAPANAFRVQVYVYNPGGVAALTSVTLSTDNGATYPITLTRNPNYYPGDTLRGIWEANVTTLTPGTWTLRAQAVNSVPKTVVSGQVVLAVNPAGRGDGNLLARDDAGQLCSDCHALATHSSETTSNKYGSWATDCRDCHTPHGTTNIYLVRQSITPPSVNGYQGAKSVKFSTTTGDSNSTAVVSASFANSDNTGPCQVCHTRTTNPAVTVARWRHSGNADAHYTSAAGTQACTGCHSHKGGFGAGESIGGAACGGCHKAIFDAMDGAVAKAARHTLGAAAGTNDSPNDSAVTWASPLSGNAAASRSCVNMCHQDHVHNQPAGTNHAYNVHQDASDGTTRAVTRDGSGNITAGTPAATDFDNAAANGGMCVSCHRNPVTTGGPVVDKAGYAASAHNYTSFGAYGAWTFTLHDTTLFDRNCTKCHADRGDTRPDDGSWPFGAVHYSDYPKLLSGTMQPGTGGIHVPANLLCYNCHGNGTLGQNLSGKDIATQVAKAGAHPADANGPLDQEAIQAGSAFGNALNATGRHSGCSDCHEPHRAKAAPLGVYQTGTASFTTTTATCPAALGSTTGVCSTVTGTGTTWTAGHVGWRIKNNTAGTWYTVVAVANATSLTVYPVPAAASGAYTLQEVYRSSNLATGPLDGAWGASLSTNPAWWTAPTGASFTKKVILSGTDLEGTLCFKCHSSWYWGTGVPPAAPSSSSYVTGTATFTSGSGAVAGSGTTWTAQMVGRVIRNNANGVWYRISAFTSATSITISPVYAGATQSGAAYTIQEAQTDTAMEFNPNNVGNYAGAWASGDTAGGFHPVLASAGSNLGATGNILPPFTRTSLMTCADCHESNGVGDPSGPHGSTTGFLLKGPNTNWSASVVALANNAWMPANTFCLNCHANIDTIGRFPDHSRGNHAVACFNCHAAVPHGGPRMGILVAGGGAAAGVGGTIAGWDTTAPYQAMASGDRLYIASYPGNNTTSWSQNNCGCNGTGH